MTKYIYILVLFISLLICRESRCSDLLLTSSPEGEQAEKNCCVISKLKRDVTKNCIIEIFDSHDLVLSIYDFSEKSTYKKADQIVITSWHNEAKVHYKDIVGQGAYFIIVEFEGNTGTGTFQKILAIIGWRKSRFVPVLIEPLSYYIDNNGRLTELNVDYEFRDIGTKNVSIYFYYNYSQKIPQKDIKFSWNDNLVWDEASFSFYGKNKIITQEKIDPTNPVRIKIVNVRKKVIKSIKGIRSIDLNVLEQLGIMKIIK